MGKIKKISFIVILLFLFCFICIFSACKKTVDNGNEEGAKLFESYSVTFDLGDKTFESLSNTLTGKVEKPNDPTRDGYTFLYWYESGDFEEVFDFDSVIEKDITLFALWEKNPNRIRFEGNGSNAGEMPDVTIESNTPVKLPLNTYSKEGYDFIGWSDIANGSVKNKDGGWFYMEEGVVTLFACWQPKTYSVLIDNDNGKDSNLQIDATYGEFLPPMKMPTKTGYVFSGYFSQKDGKGDKYCDAAMNRCKKYLLLSGTTIFAHWIVAKNTINFDGNGYTSGGTAYVNVASLDEVSLPECGFERIGYTFVGWNESADSSGRTYYTGEKFKMPVSDVPVVLYAMWLNNRYKIVFDDNFSGETYDMENCYDVTKELRKNSFSRYGYSFVAWNDKSDGTGNYYQDEQTIVNLNKEPDGEVKLFAMWKPITVLVVFNKSGGKGGTGSANITFGEYFPIIIAPTKEGYKFGGYYAQKCGEGNIYLDSTLSALNVSDLGVDGTEVYANWIPKENTIILDPNGGKGEFISIETETEKVIDLQNYSFKKSGYTLVGWNTKVNNSGDFYSFDADYVTVASNTTIKLYAIWVARSVNVIFNGNESTSGGTSMIRGYCDKEIVLPPCEFIKTGYRFIGWSETKEGDDVVLQPNTSYMIKPTDSECFELYAIWDIQYYNVNYVLNGGVNSVYNPSRYTYFSGDIKLDTPTKKGYEFKGWFEDKDYTIKTASIPSKSLGDKTFLAKWQAIKYKIIYILNGENVTNPNIKDTYDIETETFYLDDPIKPNYNFEGWAEGNVIEKGSTGNKTFTAQWSGINYNISYVLDGGTNGDGNPGTYMSDSDPITLKSPTKPGYTFTGWTSEDMGIKNPTISVTIPKNSSGNRTFIAHWEVIQYNISYVLNGGENSDENPQNYNTTDEILLQDPTRSGYSFDGWQEGSIIVQGSIGDLIFTAEWSPINYVINIVTEKTIDAKPKRIIFTIESKDIEISIDTSVEHGYIIQIGENVETFDVTNKDGYRLSGWYEYDNDDDIISSYLVESGSIGDKTITAKWELIEYTIEYDVEEDAVFEMNNPKSYNIKSDDIELQRPTRDGYIFVDWVNEDSEAIKSIPSGSFGNIKLKAIWVLDEPLPTSEPEIP